MDPYLQPTIAAPEPGVAELLIVGTGPVAGALVSIGEAAGFHVRVAAGPMFPRVGEFEGADEVIVTPEPSDVVALRPGPSTSVVICSSDEDFSREVARALMNNNVGFLGVVGEALEGLREELLDAGFTKEQVARIHAPAGLYLGATTPQEMAIAVHAEIVHSRRVGSILVTGGDSSIV